MKKYKRICVIGNSGAGKSTISRRLADIYGLPLCHIDRLYWLPGWREKDKSVYYAELAEVVSQEEWIIDGNNKSTMVERFRRADMVLFLDFNPVFCCLRAIKRALCTVTVPIWQMVVGSVLTHLFINGF